MPLDIEVGGAAVVGPDPFSWCLSGGAWTAEHVGVAYDSYRAYARGGEPERFCQVHRIPKSSTFSVARYAEDSCFMLCQLWISRMRFLYQAWVASGLETRLHFTPDFLAGYVVPADVAMLFSDAAGPSKARAESIRHLVPAV